MDRGRMENDREGAARKILVAHAHRPQAARIGDRRLGSDDGDYRECNELHMSAKTVALLR